MSFETNVDFIDVWTLVHIAVTLVLGIVVGVISRDNPKLKRKMVFGYFAFQVGAFILGVLIVTWEVFENHDTFAWLGNVNEQPLNYFGDCVVGVVCAFIGIAIGSRWNR